MSYRFRANLIMTADGKHNGIAQWCDDQAAQRISMAFHMNEGALNAEPSFHEVKNEGWEWACDMFVLDENKAILEDLYAQINSLWHYTTSETIADQERESSMGIHYCRHAEGGPCNPPYMVRAGE